LKIAPYVYQESREQEMRLFPQLTAMGVDGIITNSVDQLRAFFKGKTET
jgi:glycerophosphoryl diester phosphodiesterase